MADLIDRLMGNSEVVDVQPQQQQQTSMDAATGGYVVQDEPAPEPELTGEVGRKIRALLSQRKAAAIGQYVGMVKRLAKGETLADDELLALADAARTLRYDSTQIDSDVELVKRYAQLRSVGKEFGTLTKELAKLTAARDEHYTKLLAVIEHQKKLANAVDTATGRRDWLAGKLSDADKLKAQHPELLGKE